MIALVSYAVGILFVFGNGYYFVDVFDLFGATFPLLLIALFECLAVIFYAAKLKEMTYKEFFTAGIEKCAVHVRTSIACLRTFTFSPCPIRLRCWLLLYIVRVVYCM